MRRTSLFLLVAWMVLPVFGCVKHRILPLPQDQSPVTDAGAIGEEGEAAVYESLSLDLTSDHVFSAHAYGEVQWSGLIAEELDGVAEFRLWDATRVDVVLPGRYAIEVEWPKKWAEAPGQSLYYASALGLDPAVILLISDRRNESKYIYRCKIVCERADVALWLADTQSGQLYMGDRIIELRDPR